MVTKKTFVAVARELAKIANPETRREAALAMCATFKAQNPRFDRARFLAACNVMN